MPVKIQCFRRRAGRFLAARRQKIKRKKPEVHVRVQLALDIFSISTSSRSINASTLDKLYASGIK